MSNTARTRLAEPGAGLPAIELLIARLRFKARLKTGNRASFDQSFTEERGKIRALVDSCSEQEKKTLTLIKRPRGLEDSSRDWSVWMTLEHLRICNEAFARFITDLAHGRVPEGEASTAAVKPAPDVGAGVEAAYENTCDALLEAVDQAPHLHTKVRFPHPWFGPLDAFGWHALGSLHMAIHRGQIERIIDALRR